MRWLVGSCLISSMCCALPAMAQVPAEPPVPPPPPAKAPPAAADEPEPVDLDTPATAPPPNAAAPSAAAPAPPAANEPPPPPPRDHDQRPPRRRRPFYIAGELGWNGLRGLGVNFGYHPEPHFAIDTGLGLSLTGWRAGVRLRANLLTGEWTPFLGAGFSVASGSGGQEVDFQDQDEKAKGKILASPFAQFSVG